MVASRGLYQPAQLRRLLEPASVAIVGASPRPGAFGERLLANLQPYGGRVLLVNPRYDRIGEFACYPSLAALPEVPDCAVITVAQEGVEELVRQCIAAGVGGAIIFASGYAETAREQPVCNQAHLAELARRSGMPIVGPNCIGIANFSRQARLTFMPPADVPPPRPGAVGIVSQSGALGFALAQASERGVSLSHVLTSGNSCDVDVADYVAYLAADPACAAIALIFEGMAEPRRMVEAADLAWAAGKPLVACKLAVGPIGAAAAMSHTGSLAGSHAAYRAAFEHAGAVLVRDTEALIETACFLVKAAQPNARGVAVLATSGGAAIMAADKAEAYGVALPQPGEAARGVLEARIPDFGSARNPFDVTAQVLNDPQSLSDCGHALMADEQFGAVVIPNIYASEYTVARVPFYGSLARDHGKPICIVWITEWWDGPGAREIESESGVALFRSMDRCFASIAAWHRLAERRLSPAPTMTRHVGEAARRAAREALLQIPERILTERQAKHVLSLYGIPVVRERLAATEDAAVAAAIELGLPSVLKVESPDLPHKTEAGVISLDLRTPADVRAAYGAVLANAARFAPDARINGVLVQPMVPDGIEIMVGGRIDPLFGPIVVISLGGVLVELLQDAAVGLAPLSQRDAERMLQDLKGARLLSGFRNRPPADMAQLAEIVCRVSEFMADQQDSVAEIDVNPLICCGSRILAVDALVVKRLPDSSKLA